MEQVSGMIRPFSNMYNVSVPSLSHLLVILGDHTLEHVQFSVEGLCQGNKCTAVSSSCWL